MKRAIEYHFYAWKQHEGLNEADALRDLPQSLHVDISMYLTREIVEKVPFFLGCETAFLRSLINRYDSCFVGYFIMHLYFLFLLLFLHSNFCHDL